MALSAAYDLRTLAAELHALGVRACLAKPFDLEALLGLVARLAGPPTAT